jgi:hypothetical protein
MSTPKVSILALMVVVVVAAVDLALVRTALHDRPDVVTSVALSGLVLELALYWLIRRRGRRRAFWAGFLVAGLMATSSYGLAIGWPRVSARIYDHATRSMVTITSSGAPLARVWYPYLRFTEDCVGRLPDRFLDVLERGGLPIALADALVGFVPQLLIAFAGGSVFWLLAWLCGSVVRFPSRAKASRGRPAERVLA